jgi:hypothetical protein
MQTDRELLEITAKLGIKVSHHAYSVGAAAPGQPECIEWLTEFNLRDLSDGEKREAATRLAVARAAAALADRGAVPLQN